MTKQSYTPKFKQDAIQYYLDHRDHMKLSEIADHLGVGSDTLHKWVKKHQESGEVGRGSGNYASDKDKEIAQLKRKLRDAESTIEILKKSIGILK
jgi:transposase